MSEFLRELRDHWNDHYWWADHQALRIALLSLLSGIIGLGFLWVQLRMRRAYGDLPATGGDVEA